VIYPISELLEVARAWDYEIKKELPDNGFWFAPLLPETGEINQECTDPNDTRVSLMRKNLREWLTKNGLPYRSPHKFRHGHIHYGQAHSRTQEDYKAVSQNVMHSTTGITDQFYSNMDDEEKKKKIDSMFENKTINEITSKEYIFFLEFLEWKKSVNKFSKE
jgi:integrase